MSVGFAAVFGVAGIAITQASVTVQRYTPWVSLVIGAPMVPVGIAMLYREAALVIADRP